MTRLGLLAVLLFILACDRQLGHKLDKYMDQKEREQVAWDANHDRWISLSKSVRGSLDLPHSATAEEQANELLALAKQYRSSWNYGNAIHHANSALGRAALREGKVELAKDYLRKAGETPGSPQLDSEGPDMTLARELLGRGERDSVVRYLRLCDRFWDDKAGELKSWEKDLLAGKTPDLHDH